MTIYKSKVNFEVIGTREDGYLVEDVLDEKIKWVIPFKIFEKYCAPIPYEDELKILESNDPPSP
jgi:hypothetical protein